MAGITDVANAIFRFKKDWIYDKEGNKITDDDKEQFFFIFNRYFSKTYPEKAQLLNLKSIDKVSAMEIWFGFMKTQPYPDNFWSKGPKKEKEISEKERKMLRKSLDISDFDLDYLLARFPDLVKEELSHLAKLEKQKGK
jgi:hypothetical protein